MAHTKLESIPSFVGGNKTQEIIKERDKTVEQLTNGGESRWGKDYKALAEAAFEDGWDAAILFLQKKDFL